MQVMELVLGKMAKNVFYSSAQRTNVSCFYCYGIRFVECLFMAISVELRKVSICTIGATLDRPLTNQFCSAISVDRHLVRNQDSV